MLGRLSECTGADRQVRVCGVSMAFPFMDVPLSRAHPG